MNDTAKRSKFDTNFEEIPNSFYRTFDKKAHEAIDRHISPGTKFVEPCAGYGGLEDLGHKCTFASELIERPEAPSWIIKDALELTADDVFGADVILTNPPWKRPILHAMISHFSALKPTWLVFEADWMHTKQSIQFMPYCRKIVSIGRLKWIEGSKYGGLKDCAWYLFDQNDEPYGNVTEFVGR
jgi:hypothetical protein